VCDIAELLDAYVAARAEVLVLAAQPLRRLRLTPANSTRRLEKLAGQTSIAPRTAGARGIRAVLHPHVGTMIGRGDEVARVLGRVDKSVVSDTGHLLIGGTDPWSWLALRRPHPPNTHLKTCHATTRTGAVR